MIKLQQMKIFQMVADLGSIRAAAAALHLTQPALTRSLKELEASLDVNLIIRGTNGITLTEAGKVFKLRTEQILKDIDSTKKEVKDIVAFKNHGVSFGFSSSLAYTVLPETIKHFQEEFPKTSINLLEGQLTELLPKARSGELDFCISIIADDIPIDDFVIDAFFSMPFYIVARKGHPLEKSTSIADLNNADWCLPSNLSGYQKEVESIIISEGNDRNILRGETGEIRLSMALSTDYLTLAPAAIFKEPLFKESLVSIKVSEPIPNALYCVMHQRNFPLSPAARWLIDKFKANIGKYCEFWETVNNAEESRSIS